MRAPIPASLQDRSNKSAMLVVLNVARQLNKTHSPSRKNFSKKHLPPLLSQHQNTGLAILPDSILLDSILPDSTQDYTLRRLFRNAPVFHLERQKGQRTYIMKDKGNSRRGREARGKTHRLEATFSDGAPKGEGQAFALPV